jgi:hypothetical protein
MAETYRPNDLVLFRLQSIRGTAETNPVAGDFLQCSDFKPELDCPVTPITSSGGPGADASIPGAQTVKVSFKCAMVSGGVSGSYGPNDLPLQASRLVRTAVVTGQAVYTPTTSIAAMKAATIWYYTGNGGTTSCTLYTISEVVLTHKVSCDISGNGTGYIEYSGVGRLDSVTPGATQPTITKSTVVPVSLRGATLTCQGSLTATPVVLKFELDSGIETQMMYSMAAASGLSLGAQPDQMAKYSATIYDDSAMTIATAWFAGTKGTQSYSFGAVPNKWVVASGASKAQLDRVALADQNKIGALEISGIIIANDYTIQIHTA